MILIRSATVKCLQDCKLLYLLVSDYKQLAAAAQHAKISERFQFLRDHCALFSILSDARLKMNVRHIIVLVKVRAMKHHLEQVRHFKELKVKCGETIIRQGHLAHALYVVVRGMVCTLPF